MVASSGPVRTFGQKITRFCQMAAVLAVALPFSAPAQAQPATCDPAYWNAMKSRAWMEAQREISQNQNLIYKADSVLEYTCFNNFLTSLAANAFNLFSESTRWGTILDEESMDRALNVLVATALGEYQAGNFEHPFLGGRGDMDADLGFAVGEGAGYVYTCTLMAEVWQAAKCMNFIDEPDMDDFFLIRDYQGMDPRGLPEGMQCPVAPEWADRIAEADNTDEQYLEADYESYADFFTADACDAPPVPTGVTVRRIRANPAAYMEHVCINPGCGYDAGGGCSYTAPNAVPSPGGGGPVPPPPTP